MASEATVIATVALVYRSGGEYFPEYVRRLALSAKRHGAHDIVCLSDDPRVRGWCDHIPLETNFPGWLAKLELFKLPGPIVYFDLDTVIRRSIRPILEHDHRFTMLDDFYNLGRPASGVMAWSGSHRHIFDRFTHDHIPDYRHLRPHGGDGGWIVKHAGDVEIMQDLFPNMIASYKVGGVKNPAVVCFHGRPRPHHVGWDISGMGKFRRR